MEQTASVSNPLGTEQSIEYCLDYVRPIILGVTFLAIDMAFTPIIRADGRANVSLVGMVIGCVTNVILDPIFIFVFKWGVAGSLLPLLTIR